MTTYPTDRQLADWIERLAPDEPIDPSDPRYVPLDRPQGEQGQVHVRGPDIVLPMQDCIEVTKGGQSCQLFSGYRGNGKSTELRRLAVELRKAGFIVLAADALEYHDLFHPLTIEDLLVILAGSFGDATARHTGALRPEPGYFERLVDFLKKDVATDGATIPVADLRLLINQGRPVWLQIRDRLAAAPGKLREHAHAYIRRCVEVLRRREPGARIVFIFDSLERLRGKREDEFLETMKSVVEVFTRNARDLRLPDCHCVFTVPPYLDLVSPNLGDHFDGPVHPLPSVKLVTRPPDRAPFEPGVATLTDLVAKRLPLDEVFGQDEAALRRLVLHSGGHVRTLLALTREVLLGARRTGLPVSEDAVGRVIAQRSESLMQTVRSEGARLLSKVLDTGRLDDVLDDELPLLARFMETQVVLCYRNGDGWYEVHPLVRDHVRRLAGRIRDRPPGP